MSSVVKSVGNAISRVFKQAVNVVKKIVQSPIFKAVLIAVAIYFTAGAAAGMFAAEGTSLAATAATEGWVSGEALVGATAATAGEAGGIAAGAAAAEGAGAAADSLVAGAANTTVDLGTAAAEGAGAGAAEGTAGAAANSLGTTDAALDTAANAGTNAATGTTNAMPNYLTGDVGAAGGTPAAPAYGSDLPSGQVAAGGSSGVPANTAGVPPSDAASATFDQGNRSFMSDSLGHTIQTADNRPWYMQAFDKFDNLSPGMQNLIGRTASGVASGAGSVLSTNAQVAAQQARDQQQRDFIRRQSAVPNVTQYYNRNYLTGG